LTGAEHSQPFELVTLVTKHKCNQKQHKDPKQPFNNTKPNKTSLV